MEGKWFTMSEESVTAVTTTSRMVGAPGLEPEVSRPPAWRFSQLIYAPNAGILAETLSVFQQLLPGAKHRNMVIICPLLCYLTIITIDFLI